MSKDHDYVAEQLLRLVEAPMLMEIGMKYENIPSTEGKFNAIQILLVDFAFCNVKDGHVDDVLEALCKGVKEALADEDLRAIVKTKRAKKAAKEKAAKKAAKEKAND